MPYLRRTVDPFGNLRNPDGPIDRDLIEADEEELYADYGEVDDEDEDDPYLVPTPPRMRRKRATKHT